MLTVEIINDQTGKGWDGNYDYRIKVNGAIAACGRVEGHKRTDGWPALMIALAKDGERQRRESLTKEMRAVKAAGEL